MQNPWGPGVPGKIPGKFLPGFPARFMGLENSLDLVLGLLDNFPWVSLAPGKTILQNLFLSTWLKEKILQKMNEDLVHIFNMVC